MPDRKEIVKALIAKRNDAVRKDHERRYGKELLAEPAAAYEKRIMDNPDCWEKV